MANYHRGCRQLVSSHQLMSLRFDYGRHIRPTPNMESCSNGFSFMQPGVGTSDLISCNNVQIVTALCTHRSYKSMASKLCAFWIGCRRKDLIREAATHSLSQCASSADRVPTVPTRELPPVPTVPVWNLMDCSADRVLWQSPSSYQCHKWLSPFFFFGALDTSARVWEFVLKTDSMKSSCVQRRVLFCLCDELMCAQMFIETNLVLCLWDMAKPVLAG